MQVQDAVDGSEFPGHVRDHHMLELELRRRMNAIDSQVLVAVWG